MKPLHRMILLSSAYRQSSDSPIEKVAMEKDPENALLWKFSHRRLEAEEIRDSMLAISGRLNAKTGGPSVHGADRSGPGADAEAAAVLGGDAATNREYDRRTLYMIYKRNLRLPFMDVFDAPDTLLSCARREQSTHAPQALELLNGQTSNELAAVFAQRAAEGTRDDRRQRIDLRLAAGGRPRCRPRTRRRWR